MVSCPQKFEQVNIFSHIISCNVYNLIRLYEHLITVIYRKKRKIVNIMKINYIQVIHILWIYLCKVDIYYLIQYMVYNSVN